MERNQNRKFKRNLRDRSEFYNREETQQEPRRHQDDLQPSEDLIPTERLYQRRHCHSVEAQGAMPGMGFKHRGGPAHYGRRSEQTEGTRHGRLSSVHPEPFTAPRDLMHEKWMLEMRIYRLNKRLKRLNRRLYERFV